MILIWSNIRGLRKHRLNSPARAVKDNSTHTTFQGRISFGLCHILRALALWILDWCIHEVIIHVYTSLPLSISSFLPAKQGIWPGSNYSRADITLRSISCTHWIWGVYCGLTAAHHACAALFVSVLGWDSPADWPPLFGSVWDAYSLHRFWGVFWHRLHAARGPPRRRFGDIPGTEGASGAVGLHALGGLPRAGELGAVSPSVCPVRVALLSVQLGSVFSGDGVRMGWWEGCCQAKRFLSCFLEPEDRG